MRLFSRFLVYFVIEERDSPFVFSSQVTIDRSLIYYSEEYLDGIRFEYISCA